MGSPRNGDVGPSTQPQAPVAVALAVKSAEGKGSQRAVRWAMENLMAKVDRFVLIHVMPTITSIPTPSGESIPVEELDASVVDMYVRDTRAKCREIFIPFKIQLEPKRVETVILEGDNPAFVLLRYLSDSGTNSLVLGSCSTTYFTRKLKGSAVPSIVLKHAPETCDIYVVSSNRIMTNSLNPVLTSECDSPKFGKQQSGLSFSSMESKAYNSFEASSMPDLSQHNYQVSGPGYSSSYSGDFPQRSTKSYSAPDIQKINGCPSHSSAYSEQSDDRGEAEQLHLELQKTIALYNQACEDLVATQKKIHVLSSECLKEAQRVNAAQKREESLRKIAAEEKEKHLEAAKEVEMARKLLAKEAYERQIAELNALKESLEKQKVVDALFFSDGRYRKYTREEIDVATNSFSANNMIGEGAYGKVYKCSLDHTPVAIKVLRPDAVNGKQEFLREVEVLSQFRHPHILLLLGACPESGCLVYEYMENGNLEDHIFQRNGRPPLPWRVRFRIAFEVACGLAFLHSSKPEPIVHRDMKPGNILIDRNFVSKIGDVGLAKMISDVVPDNITEYRNSILAGTLAYMDPEYQRTGTIRPKSDLYAFGIIVLQLLTGRRPNGLIVKVENAIDGISFLDMLDKSVIDWPFAEAKELAEIGLQCCKLKCRDRPDLETEVLPFLKKLAEFADVSTKTGRHDLHAPTHYYCPILQEIMDDPHIAADGFTYEHKAIKAWLNRQNVSPVTKQKLQHKMLTPNHALRIAIQEWKSHVRAQSE